MTNVVENIHREWCDRNRELRRLVRNNRTADAITVLTQHIAVLHVLRRRDIERITTVEKDAKPRIRVRAISVPI